MSNIAQFLYLVCEKIVIFYKNKEKIKALQERPVTLRQNILYICKTQRRKRKLKEIYVVAHLSRIFLLFRLYYISFAIRFARQPARGYISRCTSTWAFDNQRRIDSRQRESCNRGTRCEACNLAGRNDTRPVFVVVVTIHA